MKLEIEPATLGRVAATLIVAALAVWVGQKLWVHYRMDPWTRAGRVRADIVQIAPDVSGLVTQVLVHDNQLVNVGDVLFVLDRPRYQLAVAQARATVDALRVQIVQARREHTRNQNLQELVSAELREQSSSKIEHLGAQLLQANAALETARLNLTRTQVKASVHGQVTNLDLRPGSFVPAGKPVLALVDQDSLYVVGYFEETKIGRIEVGDKVEVRLMGDSSLIEGHVDSIAGGIEDRERTATSGLLANVNPTFNWVRLAQRVPVRVHLDLVPEGVRLIMGRTATVEVVGPGPETPAGKKP